MPASKEGLVIVDISDPARPVMVCHYSAGYIYDVKVKDNFAYRVKIETRVQSSQPVVVL